MSVLVYRNRAVAGAAAATLIAAQIIEKPASVLGLDVADDMASVYRALSRMTGDGLLDWSDATAFGLSEYVSSDTDLSLTALLSTLLYNQVNLKPERRFAPDSAATDWSIACSEYEDAILQSGGFDLVFLSVRADGSVAFHPGAPELAPVTHVERTENGRVVTVGMSTLMSARKIVAQIVGADKMMIAERICSGTITPEFPATYLQLHANAVFLFDEDAAAHL